MRQVTVFQTPAELLDYANAGNLPPTVQVLLGNPGALPVFMGQGGDGYMCEGFNNGDLMGEGAKRLHLNLAVA